MSMDVNIIERLIRQVVEEVEIRNFAGQLGQNPGSPGRTQTANYQYGIFDTMDEAVEASAAAFRELAECTLQQRQAFIRAIRETVLKPENLEAISQESVVETGIGNVDHKLIKNRLAAEKTPGMEDLITEAQSGDHGLTITEYCPFGVIGGITPTTNPTETVISNSIGMIAGGNTVVFSPHPRARQVTIHLITLLNQALEQAGAPQNLIATVQEPSIENTNRMMEHPLVRLLVATGGPSIVHKVMSSGKKAIGAGAGNPPVVVDETADIEKAAKDIVDGCSFDHNVPCIAEKEVFAVAEIFDELVAGMVKQGAYLMTDPVMTAKLQEMVTDEKGGPKVSFVGKSAGYILEQLGLYGVGAARVIILETTADHHFVNEEMMMPILPLVRVSDVDQAIACAYIAEHGNRHTAMIHSRNIDKITKMARLLETTIFVKNAPSYAGIGAGGEGHTTFTIAGPTGEGLTSARSFCRKRRCVMVDGLNIK